MNSTGTYWVYIVQCRFGTYYTGYTTDLERRLSMHNTGKGAKYLRGKTPVKLVFSKKYRYLKNALRAEWNLKQLTRIQKERLVKHATHLKPRTD
jgi:putative endonuclease